LPLRQPVAPRDRNNGDQRSREIIPPVNPLKHSNIRLAFDHVQLLLGGCLVCRSAPNIAGKGDMALTEM